MCGRHYEAHGNVLRVLFADVTKFHLNLKELLFRTHEVKKRKVSSHFYDCVEVNLKVKLFFFFLPRVSKKLNWFIFTETKQTLNLTNLLDIFFRERARKFHASEKIRFWLWKFNNNENRIPRATSAWGTKRCRSLSFFFFSVFFPHINSSIFLCINNRALWRVESRKS